MLLRLRRRFKLDRVARLPREGPLTARRL